MSRLSERCEAELERFIAGARNCEPDERGYALVSVPRFRAGCWVSQDSIPSVIREIRTAMGAQLWFTKHGPAWAQWRLLPLDIEEQAALEREGGLPFLLATYAFSLGASTNYDFLRHPEINIFSRGVM